MELIFAIRLETPEGTLAYYVIVHRPLLSKSTLHLGELNVQQISLLSACTPKPMLLPGKKPKAGEQIAKMMMDAGLWEAGNITEGQVLLLLNKLFKRFGIVGDETGDGLDLLLA